MGLPSGGIPKGFGSRITDASYTGGMNIDERHEALTQTVEHLALQGEEQNKRIDKLVVLMEEQGKRIDKHEQEQERFRKAMRGGSWRG